VRSSTFKQLTGAGDQGVVEQVVLVGPGLDPEAFDHRAVLHRHRDAGDGRRAEEGRAAVEEGGVAAPADADQAVAEEGVDAVERHAERLARADLGAHQPLGRRGDQVLGQPDQLAELVDRGADVGAVDLEAVDLLRHPQVGDVGGLREELGGLLQGVEGTLRVTGGEEGLDQVGRGRLRGRRQGAGVDAGAAGVERDRRPLGRQGGHGDDRQSTTHCKGQVLLHGTSLLLVFRLHPSGTALEVQREPQSIGFGTAQPVKFIRRIRPPGGGRG
jgi:hypothetical protein